jgi:hypothetical protein
MFAVATNKNVYVYYAKMSQSTQPDLTSRALVLNFMDMMKQFLCALREVFPECPKVMAYDVAFTLKTSGKTPEEMDEMGMEAMRAYHTVMSPWYTRCTRRDESLVNEHIEFMEQLDLGTKWRDNMHPDTKDAIWEYINQLNNFCCLMSWTHDVLPPNIMSVITSNATEVADKIKSGQLKMSDLNVMDLSQKIMGAVDPAELEQLGQSLQSGDGVDLGSVYTMLNNMAPKGEDAQNMGGMDMGGLLSSMLPSLSKK